MIKLNIFQQIDEIRDIENYIRGLDPLAVVELQSQQIKRLIYFSKKGIENYKTRHGQYNQEYADKITAYANNSGSNSGNNSSADNSMDNTNQ